MRTRIQIALVIAPALAKAAAAAAPAGGGGTAVAAEPLPPAVVRLVRAAWEAHPQVAAARAGVARFRAGQAGIAGFYDPRLLAGGGWAQEDRAIPGATPDFGVPDEAAAAAAGVEVPVRPGAYLGAGVAERYYTDPAGGDGGLYESLAGVQVRIPLLRDRGFAQWRADRARADAEVEAALGRWRAATQQVERDAVLAYLAWQQALAQRAIATGATARAARLLAEAGDLVRLQALPPYQLHPARLELSLRREEETAAVRTCATARRQLGEAVGMENLAAADLASADLSTWADAAALPPAEPVEAVLARRGTWIETRGQLAADEARLRAAENDERTDLSLRAGYTWLGEDRDTALARGREPGGRSGAGAVALAWRAPLGSRAERARTEEARAAREERAEALRRIAWQVAAEVDLAREEFGAAAGRLAHLGEAVRDAGEALAAEEERFRLGEGTSRQVLDAQKDLTAVLRRRDDILTDLLRAWTRHRYAAGLGGAPGIP